MLSLLFLFNSGRVFPELETWSLRAGKVIQILGSPTLHTMYDTPWLRAVLGKLSPFLQTQCLTWLFHHIEQGGIYPDSSPRTRPLNNFNVTSGSFPSSTPFCPQWLSKHKQGLMLHIAYTTTRPACTSLPPSLPCCSLAFICEFWLGVLATACVRTGAALGKGSAELQGVGQRLASPQTLTLLWSWRQAGPAAIPVLEHDQESLFSLFQH